MWHRRCRTLGAHDRELPGSAPPPGDPPPRPRAIRWDRKAFDEYELAIYYEPIDS